MAASPDPTPAPSPEEAAQPLPIMLSTEMRFKAVGGAVHVGNMPGELLGEVAERTCQRNHGQTLARIAQRGGFDATEAVRVLACLPLDADLNSEESAHRILYAMRFALARGLRIAGADEDAIRRVCALDAGRSR